MSTDTKVALESPGSLDDHEDIRAHSIIWAREVEQIILKMTPIAQRHAELLIEKGYSRLSAVTITQGAVRKACDLSSERTRDELYRRLLMLQDDMEAMERELQSVRKEGQ